MAERDRTTKFVKHRDAFRRDEEVERRARAANGTGAPVNGTSSVLPFFSGAIGGGAKPEIIQEETSVILPAAPPRWMGFVDDIRVDMKRIENKMRELVELHGQHLLTTFDDDGSREHNIEILTRDITRLFQSNNARLKKFGEKIPGNTPEQEKMRKNVRSQLVRQMQTLSQEFRNDQKIYLQKLRGQAAKGDLLQLGKPKDDYSDEEIEPEPFNVNFTDDQVQLVVWKTKRVQEQSKEIREIVKSINELAEIMDDLALLVHEQGSILERIDYNIEQVETTVIQATKELKESHESVKKTKTKMCVCGLVILIVLVAFILVIKTAIFK